MVDIAVIISMDFIKFIQGLEIRMLLAQDMAAEEMRQDLEDLVVHMRRCGDGKDVVEFLEGALFRFGDPEINHY